MDIADEGTIQKRFRFRPELIPGFSVPLGICDKGRDQLQNIFFAVNIGERVIVHGLLEVDRVKDLDFVVITLQQLANLAHDTSFRIGHHI